MLEAQETLLNLKISEYHQMEGDDKKKLLKEFKSQAYFKEDLEKEQSSGIILKTSDIAKALGKYNVWYINWNWFR